MSSSFIGPNSKPLFNYLFWQLDYDFYTLIQLLWREFCPSTSDFCNFRVDAICGNYRLCFKGLYLISFNYCFFILPIQRANVHACHYATTLPLCTFAGLLCKPSIQLVEENRIAKVCLIFMCCSQVHCEHLIARGRMQHILSYPALNRGILQKFWINIFNVIRLAMFGPFGIQYATGNVLAASLLACLNQYCLFVQV